ncbi:MAG: hypothetical protein ACTSQA_01365 [Candidatus Heimdallarchaeaceae archaeon]
MAQDTLLKFEVRKQELEKELKEQEKLLSNFSKSVSETQILILELRGRIKELIKMINSLKG